MKQNSIGDPTALCALIHELKAPLATISGYAKLLEKQLDPARATEYLRVIQDEAKNLSATLDDLLLAGSLDALPSEPSEPVNVSEQLRRAFAALEPQRAEKDLHFSLKLGRSQTVAGHAWMHAHIWRNLAENAVKFSPAGGEITAQVRRKTDGRLVVSVRNFGQPIPEQSLGRIFEMFFRAGNTDATGHGMGLAIVSELVARSGGSITVTSSEEKGTCFTVTL